MAIAVKLTPTAALQLTSFGHVDGKLPACVQEMALKNETSHGISWYSWTEQFLKQS